MFLKQFEGQLKYVSCKRLFTMSYCVYHLSIYSFFFYLTVNYLHYCQLSLKNSLQEMSIRYCLMIIIITVINFIVP